MPARPARPGRRPSGTRPEPYPGRTGYTPTSWRTLSAALDQVRIDGIAESNQEYELGLNSFATRVPSVDGGQPSAISVSPPTSRATRSDRGLLTAELLQAAEAITAAMRLIGS